MIKMHIIGSGSKGNASIIYDEKTTILVDLGISKRRLNQGLKEINKTIDDIDFALFTHDHTDHIKNASILNFEKIYGFSGVLDFKNENILYPFERRQMNTFNILPLSTSHDATNSCGFLFKSGNEELVYITDTGIIPFETLAFINNKNYYFLESNYDIEMLLNSSRPNSLKARILSHKGHLSNEDCLYYLKQLVGDKTTKVIFAHISEECNDESIIIDNLNKEIAQEGKFKNIEFKCAYQKSSVDL